MGRALAQEFLRCGDSVIICSRDSEGLQASSGPVRVMRQRSIA